MFDRYIPPDPEALAFEDETGDLLPGPNIATAEDAIVDDGGHICIDALHWGSTRCAARCREKTGESIVFKGGKTECCQDYRSLI